MHTTHPIDIFPYNPNWPHLFNAEADAIKKALGPNCIKIHHIGSTSVPGLASKAIIDIVPVVQDLHTVDANLDAMIALGYESHGEYGIFFRRFFKKSGFNVHLFEANSGEIEGHLLFRDWMRNHEEDKLEYAQLKQDLALRYPHDMDKYVFGKDAFIKTILDKTEFKGLRIVKALTPREWDTLKQFRQQYCFSNNEIQKEDPYAWTFEDAHHAHLILYAGSDIIGYTHIQLRTDQHAILRVILIDKAKRHHHFGETFLHLCEKWLKTQHYKSIHVASSPAGFSFYRKNGYFAMPFDALAEENEEDINNITMGKLL